MLGLNSANPKVISGTLLEYSSGTSESTNSGNSVSKIVFMLVRTAEGEVVRINNVVVDAHIKQQMNIGEFATFYVYSNKSKNVKRMRNTILAVKSDNGVGIFDTQGFTNYAIRSLIMGAIISCFCGFIGGMILESIFGNRGLFYVYIVGLIVMAVFVMYSFGIMRIKILTEKLRHELSGPSDQYRGTVIKNI